MLDKAAKFASLLPLPLDFASSIADCIIVPSNENGATNVDAKGRRMFYEKNETALGAADCTQSQSPQLTLADSVSRMEKLARPLLEVMQRITGLETTFITEIDWQNQRQDVVVALNTAELQVPEGSSVSWHGSMCRLTFLSGRPCSSHVDRDFADNAVAKELGMQTFFALPILYHDEIIGTVCGASSRSVVVEPTTLELVQLIAEGLGHSVGTDRELRKKVAHVQYAESQTSEALRQAANDVTQANKTAQLALVDSLTGLPQRE